MIPFIDNRNYVYLYVLHKYEDSKLTQFFNIVENIKSIIQMYVSRAIWITNLIEVK